MALDACQNFVSAQCLKNEWNMTKFCICIDIDKIQVGIVMRQILQIYNRVMALESSQNFVTVQYLKNEWKDFNKILHTL